MRRYEPKEVEKKWQDRWESEQTYTVDLETAKKPFYTHAMFPYPSGDKLHVGHWYNFAPADTFARFKRMQGFDVFSPMGFDAFGLPAENYAVKTGVHPATSIRDNVETMIRQLKRIGCMYDWTHMVNTSTPEYYKWTQWLFLLMLKRGLAYKREQIVYWDPIDKTVLAREQVLPDGTAERSGAIVEQKSLEQWSWRITDYAEELLEELDKLDWPARTVAMQKNWIGKSQGVTFCFQVKELPYEFRVYDSIPQTFMAQTFVAIAPEHALVPKLAEGTPYEEDVADFVEAVKKRKIADKYTVQNEVEGVFTGRYVKDPFGTGDLPIWVASYVLADYGTGVVSCSAHDERDFAFAKKFDIPLRVVMAPKDPVEAQKVWNLEYSFMKADDGVLIDPPEFRGRLWGEVREDIIDYIEENGIGERSIQYRLRDWTVSRQRYWGAPIPVVYDPDGNAHPVPEEHLPWKLPTDVDFEPTGVSPLAKSEEFVERTERIFGKGWRPEFDTMDTFVCSSFYSQRFVSANDTENLIAPNLDRKWMPVDLYIGGAEHACMHLIYARFVAKVLAAEGISQHPEPYKRLVHQGIITNAGSKMSKSKGNVVSPDAFVDEHGADVFRLYLMFLGPYSDGADWSDTGIRGSARFVKRVFTLFRDGKVSTEVEKDDDDLIRELHETIESMTIDLERLHFNTAISGMMKLLNSFEKTESISEQTANIFVRLLAPLTPHLAEELWVEYLGNEFSVFNASWPEADAEVLKNAEVDVPVMVNKKFCTKIKVSPGISAEAQQELAVSDSVVVEYLSKRDLTVKRVISKAETIVTIVTGK